MNTRTIIIGDIHGCFAELERLLAELSVTPDDLVVSVGDLVDRGPDSERVWDFFRTRPRSVAIMGNHERKHVRGVLSYSQEIVKLQLAGRYEAFRAWAAELPYYLDLPECIVVHGGFEDGVSLPEQRQDVLSATTSGCKYLDSLYQPRHWQDEYSGAKPIAFGHHVVGDRAKVWQDKLYGLDTGACHGGYLTALVLPGFTTHSVKAERDYWSDAMRRWELPVLKAKPWADTRWGRLDRLVPSLRAKKRPATAAFARDVARWLDDVKSLVSPLIERLEARAEVIVEEVGEGDGKALKKRVAREPDGTLLFGALAGTLDRKAVIAHLNTPGALLASADRHGLRAPEPLDRT